MDKKMPAISIVTPMYNVEKYIADCLESVLAQTFTDYEFIVVDDCSTDNSCEIVESYIPKFGGKLKLIHSEKNSTNPSTPRNTGIRLSRGEYICFLDSDDGLMPTALEEMHNLINKFHSDVIHCERYYLMPQGQFTTNKNLLEINSWKASSFVDKPTFWTDDLEQRLRILLKGELSQYTWNHIVRRDLLLKCNIIFPPMRISDDGPYTLHLVCESKTFLIVPNIIYIYRMREGSQSCTALPMEKWVYHRISSVFCGLLHLNKLLNNLKLFHEHPELKFTVMDIFLLRQMYDIGAHYQLYPVHKLDPLIQRELNNLDGDKTALTSFLFSRMNILSAVSEKNHELIKKLSTRIANQNSALEKHLEVIQTQAVQIKQLERQLEELRNG